MNANCPYCSYGTGNSKDAPRAFELHITRFHCRTATASVKGKGSSPRADSHPHHLPVGKKTGMTDRVIGQSIRASPTAAIQCFIPNCVFEADSWRKIEGHVAEAHQVVGPFSTAFEIFGVAEAVPSPVLPSTVPRSSSRRRLYSDHPVRSGVSPEGSPPPPLQEVRATRPRTAQLSIPISSRPTPYDRRVSSPSPSRTPSVSPTKPSNTFSYPATASPLVRIIFSRPTSPQALAATHDAEEESSDDEEESEVGEDGDVEYSDEMDEDEDDNERVASGPQSENDDEESEENDDERGRTGASSEGNVLMDTDIDPPPMPVLNFDDCLERAALRIISLSWRSMPIPRFVACTTCEVGINPKVAIKHAKDHGVVLSAAEVELLSDYLLTAPLATEQTELPIPPANSPPLTGLVVRQGF
ncbi:hypothetical protein GALMADRAFT_1343720, partial [Galerina marginata CBS 339.88]